MRLVMGHGIDVSISVTQVVCNNVAGHSMCIYWSKALHNDLERYKQQLNLSKRIIRICYAAVHSFHDNYTKKNDLWFFS